MDSPESVRDDGTLVPYSNARAIDEIGRYSAPYSYISPKEPTLRDYWHILLRRKWVVGSVLLIVMTLVTIVTLRMPAMYESSGRISVARENPDFMGLRGAENSSTDA